jgi:transposase InsO family protein
VAPDVARGIQLRHDWDPQYLSGHFQGTLKWLGIEDSPAYAGEPSCNGCAERYNSNWLIERHGHRTLREDYDSWLSSRRQVA